MFDIGFAELLVIAVVSLIVLGPQRLPETVRFVGLWVGRMKRALSSARRELEQEMGVDEIRRQLHNEDILRSLGENKTGEGKNNLRTPANRDFTNTDTDTEKNHSTAAKDSATVAPADSKREPR